MQQHKFDVSSSQEGRYLLLVDLKEKCDKIQISQPARGVALEQDVKHLLCDERFKGALISFTAATHFIHHSQIHVACRPRCLFYQIQSRVKNKIVLSGHSVWLLRCASALLNEFGLKKGLVPTDNHEKESLRGCHGVWCMILRVPKVCLSVVSVSLSVCLFSSAPMRNHRWWFPLFWNAPTLTRACMAIVVRCCCSPFMTPCSPPCQLL